MAVFVVNYFYSADPEHVAEVRPQHRAWLKEQFDAGRLLANGPMVGLPTALLIWRADDVESLAELLDQDPFDQANMIGERTIAEWNPIYGPFSN
jgi:hypothetical protein